MMLKIIKYNVSVLKVMNLSRLKVEECKSHVLIRSLSYFSKWKR